MDKRKMAPHMDQKHKSTKTNIHISSEYHQEKAGYRRIRRKRKSPATQDPQDRPRIFQHQIMLNERMIQVRRESSREGKATPRKHKTSLAGDMTVKLKANKCREKRPWRPRSPSTSSCGASTCFVSQVKAAHFYRETRIVDYLSFDITKLHS
jgi:hypothetical protein